jgi:hypothetical protein
MASPATKLPRVSCNARPATTAPTADVVRNFSWKTSVATSAKSVKTMTSWTIVGKRSGTRSAASGLTVTRTTKWMIANANSSCAIEPSSALVSEERNPVVASAASIATNASARAIVSRTRLAITRFFVRSRIASPRTSRTRPDTTCAGIELRSPATSSGR